MESTPHYADEPAEYINLPAGPRESREWQTSRALDERALDAQGRLTLGCCIIWVSGGGYLLTALPPMGDVRGDESQMVIHTGEYTVTIRGENLHLLAQAMKMQRIDNLRVGTPLGWSEQEAGWVIRSMVAEKREDE